MKSTSIYKNAGKNLKQAGKSKSDKDTGGVMSNPEGYITATDKIHELVAENNRLREALDNITMMHDGNMSDAMAGMPEIDYARFVMSNMRKEARTALSVFETPKDCHVCEGTGADLEYTMQRLHDASQEAEASLNEDLK